MTTTTTATKREHISVEDTARRTYRSEREVIRLITTGKIRAEKLNSGQNSPWLVYWPSVVKYFEGRGIIFSATSTP